ncbi:MAG: phosphatase PAP2 family protein [Bacillota bacterium]
MCLHTFGYLAEEMSERDLAVFDETLTGWLSNLIDPSLMPLMIWASFLGSTPAVGAVTGLAALYFLRRKSYREAFAVTATSFGAFLLETALKEIFRRPRPPITHLIEAYGYSFPSGHATVTAALFLVLSYLWYRHTRNRFRYIGPAAAALLILLIGVSRVYLGVHYPSDVLAGFAVGILWGLVITFFKPVRGRPQPVGEL